MKLASLTDVQVVSYLSANGGAAVPGSLPDDYMDDFGKDALIVGALAVGAYLVYKNFFAAPLDQTQTANALSNAGLNVTTPQGGNGAVYAQSTNLLRTQNTTFKFNPGDASQLNAAQRILIGLDRVVPGTWLTELALT